MAEIAELAVSVLLELGLSFGGRTVCAWRGLLLTRTTDAWSREQGLGSGPPVSDSHLAVCQWSMRSQAELLTTQKVSFASVECN